MLETDGHGGGGPSGALPRPHLGEPRGCRKLTDAEAVALAWHCPGLTSVDLEEFLGLVDAAAGALAEHCPGPTSVHLRGCG